MQEELNEYSTEATGIIIAGDLNIHHRKWLRFSNGDTPVGQDMKMVCDNFGLLQMVKEPTRGEYLLDLFISDIHCKVGVGSSIADHKPIIATIPLPEPSSTVITRDVWILQKANWSALEKDLKGIDWRALGRGTAEDALHFFMEVFNCLQKHVPYKTIRQERKSHPWLNEKCEEAVTAKRRCEGTDQFIEAQAKCAQVLTEEYQKYLADLKEKIAGLSKSSKQWWRLNRELLNKKAQTTSIPPLKSGDNWLSDSKAKADAFAETFTRKSQLPAEVIDTPFFGLPDVEFDEFVAIRSRYTEKLLKELDTSKASGHDRLPASILKRLANCIAVPFTRVCRRLLHEGCWPRMWKLHCICPLFKRGSAFSPGNYRGVHLTPILSKIAEKVMCRPLIQYLQRCKFGQHQWAFTPGLSARDLVTALMMSWILLICKGKKVGGYLGDISGAFDRVSKEYLIAKLNAAGVGSMYLNFLDAYLAPRRGQVLVEGKASETFEIANSVFQGTVLGPTLWNVFFADIVNAACSTGGIHRHLRTT